MDYLQIAAYSVGLGLDAMSVCAGIGVKWHGGRQKFRLSFHMGLFQFLMPVLGWLGGRELAMDVESIKNVGTYIGAALVAAIGAKMLYEAIKSHPGGAAEGAEHAMEHTLHYTPKDPTRGWSLVMLSVATSIDALVAGVALGLGGRANESGAILIASIVIGLVAAAMSLFGVAVGRRMGQAFGRWAEIAGAVVLILLGVSFLVI